ncbi:MAG: ATP-binding cassette domain-containing protein [Propionibacteriaceae bacterium]|nr:ATP-binding cassette domain-containing protein [Propionibacteriaceae bacterium]
MDIITTSGLTKAYGRATVVADLDLRVPKGCVYGFLGPNGSGKSTTMKMLLALAQPTAGTIRIFGEPMTRTTRRRLLAGIGSLIEAPSVYGHLTGAENMRVVQKLLGLSDDEVRRALATVRLEQHRDKLVRNYSLGMKQRLGIAMALARSPRLLVLDEPTNGLDPAGIEEIRELLVSLAADGITVMVSSHLLAEMDKMAEVLGIIDHGRLIFQGTRAELFARSVPDLVIETPDPARAQEILHRAHPARTPDGITITRPDPNGTALAVAHLVRHDVAIHEVRRRQQSLEEVFIDLTGRGGDL